MTQRELTVSEALELCGTMPFAYIARLSSVFIGAAPKDFSLDELSEARFFGPDREIRIYYDGAGLSAMELREESEDHCIDKESDLLPNFGTKIVMRKYLAFDEDGQGYIAATRLLRWEG